MPPSDTADTSATKTKVSVPMQSLVTVDDSSQCIRMHATSIANANEEEIVKRDLLPEETRLKPTSLHNNDLLRTKHSYFNDIPPTRDITMWRRPGYTLRFFVMAIVEALPKRWPWALHRTMSVTLSLVVALVAHHQGKRGTFDRGDSTSIKSACTFIQTVTLETLFWIGCGVLSTIGLGSGVQTGALFLFPHVCRLSLAWSKLQIDVNKKPSLATLMWSVAIPGFWSGTGSAAGELVPFLLARLIRQSGKDPFALLHGEIPSGSKSLSKKETSSTLSTSESNDSLSSTESSNTYSDFNASSEKQSESWLTPQLLLSNTRVAMESQLSSNTFWKIFTLAVVPNALFDLAGLVCGASSDVSWWEFFLATWFAKAVIRTPAQTCGLAVAVVAITSPGSLAVSGILAVKPDLSMAVVAPVSSTTGAITDFLERWGRMALAEFLGEEEPFLNQRGETLNASTDPSIVFECIKTAWSLITALLFVFFIVSTIEQVAQHHVRTKHELNQHHEESIRQPSDLVTLNKN